MQLVVHVCQLSTIHDTSNNLGIFMNNNDKSTGFMTVRSAVSDNNDPMKNKLIIFMDKLYLWMCDLYIY